MQLSKNSIGGVLSLAVAVHVATAVVSAQSNAYVSNLSGNTVSVVNMASGSIAASVAVPAGPTGLAVSPDGSTVYVASQSANVVSVIGTASNSVIASINVGSTPTQLAMLPNGNQVYVVNQGSNQVSIIDTASKSVTANIGVGSRPSNLAVSPDGSRVYVTNLWSGDVWVIDTQAKAVVAQFAASSGPSGIALSPDGKTVYVANEYANTVTIHDANSGNLLNTLGNMSFPNWLSISPNGSRLLVTNGNASTVSVIDTAAQSVIATVPVGSVPTSVAVSPDGSHAFVTNEYGFSLSILDMGSNSIVNTVQRVGVYPIVVAVPPAPARTGCSISISPGSANFAQTGGNGTVNVSAPSGCPWTAASNSGWLSVSSGANGSGNGTVVYNVSPNPSGSSITGILTIGGQTFTVTAQGLTCSLTLGSSSATATANGGFGTIPFTTPSGCAWNATSDSGWLAIQSASSGSGSTTMSYLTSANPNATARTGNITIGSQQFTVTQAGTGFSAIRVNCGGGAMTDSNGLAWAADSQRNMAMTSAAVGNTGLPALYQKESWSTSTLQYQYAVPNGSFTVKLHFAEFYLTQRGQRVFNIVINGNTVYSNFDILAFTNPNTAYDVTFPVSVSNGQVTVQLVPVTGPAKLSGLEIY